MPETIPVSSFEELKETLQKARDKKKKIGRETIHIRLEDYVSRSNGDFLHEPYILFSASVTAPHGKKSIAYSFRQRLFPADYLPFGKYSIDGPQTEFTMIFINDITKAAQKILDSYLVPTVQHDGYLLGFDYKMHTTNILVKMQRKRKV